MDINIIDNWSVDKFKKRLIIFSKIARTTIDSDRWIFCTDLFTNQKDFNDDKKIISYRKTVKDKVKSQNMPRVKYISGRELLKIVKGLSTDFTHLMKVLKK